MTFHHRAHSASATLAMCAFLGLVSPAGASSFLARAHSQNTIEGKALHRDAPLEVLAVDAQLQDTILAQIENTLGSDHRKATEGRLNRIEDMLRATFVSMAKNEFGNLAHSSVRYVLHRYFVQQHAWFVKGLATEGASWNSSSPTEILQNHVDELVQSLFEKRLGARGLNLHETAVLAATMENLVHQETMGRLNGTLKALDLEGQVFVEAKVDTLLDTYMMSYITGSDLSHMTPQEVERNKATMSILFPEWPATQRFIRDVRGKVLNETTNLQVADVTKVIESVADRYGHWQNQECQELKSRLVRLEDQSQAGAPSGRVALSEFYRSALHGDNWQFTETPEYLRELGALDEADPNRPQILISNYVNSPTNCLASSKFYSVCCLDECEDLMDNIEHKVAAPDAPPAVIAEVVAGIPSVSMSAGRTLPATLIQRLDDIAATHGGTVPLHGRLFAQWMHHAYPRECPFPHLAGTTSPKRAEELEGGRDAGHLTREGMELALAAVDAKSSHNATGENIDLAWHHEEELLADLPAKRPARGFVARAAGRTVAFLALCASMGLALAASTRREGSKQKKIDDDFSAKDHFL